MPELERKAVGHAVLNPTRAVWPCRLAWLIRYFQRCTVQGHLDRCPCVEDMNSKACADASISHGVRLFAGHKGLPVTSLQGTRLMPAPGSEEHRVWCDNGIEGKSWRGGSLRGSHA
jgi:hypothetical protein